jgi:hypothetical protein
MRVRRSSIFAAATLLGLALLHACSTLPPPASAALGGTVTSAEEGPMEGVLVSAKGAGSTVTITVVSDHQGRYSFPAGKLAPGRHALKVRAVGYDLDQAATVDVPATLDLRLRKAADLAAQLSNAEWMASMPGTDQQKGLLLNCVGCHTIERIARSPHTAETLMTSVPGEAWP